MSADLAELLTAPSLEQVRSICGSDLQQVDALIERELRSDVPLVLEIAQHIVHSGGKRLRPLMAMLSALACNYDGTDHIKLAALIEFLHTATLLHDDVVDQSMRRRNRRTANAVWGNSACILVGDFLYSRAFQLMVEIQSMPLMSIISDATNVIAEGEVLQLQNVGNTRITEAQYMDIIRRKTAMLFQAATHTGAVLGGADGSCANKFRSFGLHFGLSYQLIDDLLDYAGSSESMGKNVGDDLSEGKATLPLIIAMKTGLRHHAACIRHAITERTTESLQEVIESVRASGALDYTRAKAMEHTRLAIDSLNGIAESPHRSGLETLAEIAVCRLK